MDVEIWCIGDLNYFVAVLNCLAMIAQSGLFEDLVRLGLILAVLTMAIEAAFMGGGNMPGGLPWGRFIIAWVLFKFLFATTTTVWVYDTYSLKTMEVDNVPYGVAYAGSFTSKVAHEITAVLEQAFSTPTMLNDGFAAPLQILMKTRNLSQGLGKIQNGNVQKTLVQYVQDCTSVGINLGQISMDNLVYQENPWQAMKFDSGIYTTMTWLPGDPAGGNAQTCSEAWNSINNYLSGNLWDDWNGYLKTVFCDSNDPSCNPQQKIQNSLDAMVTVSQNAQYYMMSAVLLPALDQGQINANSVFGKPEMSTIIGQAREQRNAQWVAESSLFANIVRPLMAFFEGFLYAVTPFMALLVAFVPSGIKLIFKFFAMFIWIQMWMPVMAVLNHYLQIILQQKLTSLVVDAAIPLTSIQGQLMGMSTINDWLATAGMLASSTPAISLALLYGGAITMTHLAGRLQHGDFVNEKIAAPDVVRPGAVVGMPPLRNQIGDIAAGGQTLHHTPGFEAMDGKVVSSQINSQEVASRASQMNSAQQTFKEGIVSATARGNQGVLGQSNQWQSSSGLDASSREQYASAALYSAMKAKELGLNQTDTQRFIGAMTTAAGGGMSGTWQPGKTPEEIAAPADPSKARTGYGARGEAGVNAALRSEFGTDRGQQLADKIRSDLNLRDDKSLQTAIDEKLTSTFARGQTRQFQDVLRQDDIKNLENSAQKVEQSQKEFSEAERMASQQGARQAVPFMAIAQTMMKAGMTPAALTKMDQDRFHGALLPPGKIAQEAGWFKRFNPRTTDKDANMWGIVSTLHKNTMNTDPRDQVVRDESRRLLMGFMNRVGMPAKDAGGAYKFQGLMDPGKLESAGEHAKQASMGLKGPGDVPGGISGIKKNILPPQGQQEVRDWGESNAAGLRSLQEGHRMEAAREQYGKTLDDTIREFDQKKSYSQTFAESGSGALQGLGSGVREGLSAMLSGAYKLSPKAAQQAWDQGKQQLWDNHLQEGKKLGLDDNLSKVYAQGAMHGWNLAAKEHTGLSLPMPKQYETDRAQAVQSRSQYLQEQGYSPDAARHRAEQEVFLAEKAGQTGMSNWAGRVAAGEKLFSQTHEARWNMGPTSGNLQQYEPFINRAAQQYNVSPALIRSVIRPESSGNPRAVSPKGAMGLMQLMPGTAQDMGVKNAYDPEENIMGGTRYLKGLLDKYEGDRQQLPKALAAYNAGPDRVPKHLPLENSEAWKIGETRGYVNKAMLNYKLGRSFYATPANPAESGRAGKGLMPQAAAPGTMVPQGPVPPGRGHLEIPQSSLSGPPNQQPETGVRIAEKSPSREGVLPPASRQPETIPRSLTGPTPASAAEPGRGEKGPGTGQEEGEGQEGHDTHKGNTNKSKKNPRIM